MWKEFLKRSGWTDLIISLIFILFGIMLMARPETIMAIISNVLGLIFIVMGILKIIQYYSTGKINKYLIPMSTILIIVGIVVMFCTEIILSLFRILIAIWIIYTGIMNFHTSIVWKEYKSKLWVTTLILSFVMILAGIYVLVNSGAIIQTIGIILVLYGIVDIIENIIFIKKVDNYLD
mgnify:FL=1